MPAKCSTISPIAFSEDCELCARDAEEEYLTHEFRSLTPAQRNIAPSPCALSLPGSHTASPKLEALPSAYTSPVRGDMSPLSPPRFTVPGGRNDVSLSVEGGRSKSGESSSCCPHRGKLFLSSVQAMFLLGSGENVFEIGAVLSCLPAVNGDVSALAKKANIEHHAYFLLDDNDALTVRLGDGSPTSSPRSSTKQRLSVTPPPPTVQDGDKSSDDNIFHKFQDGPALRNALQFIHANRLANRNVLVHCDGGVLRSPATVISYLMAFTSRSMAEASSIVKRCRSIVHVRLLEDSLQAFETSLHNSSANSHSCQSVNFGDRSSFEFGAASTMHVPESECVVLDPVRSTVRGRTSSSDSHSTPRLCATRTPYGPLGDSDDDRDPFHRLHDDASAGADIEISHQFSPATATTAVTVTPFTMGQRLASSSTSSRNVLIGALSPTISNAAPTKPLNKPFLSVRID
ncbi:dual specificity protein phosphatase, putative [Bodo saltans]|uniref:protein-tyrosine-phosphatase n=1 Tax=Bodo saltans TaxID=75058 RepID=A0A0S4KKQ9_BODSA|nr:dual specificity protein phosphatase, putative [Bodo saltans]|eukprot:CUI15163.1 dual specificity protein phosphatase, putative [Bodo saltans]